MSGDDLIIFLKIYNINYNIGDLIVINKKIGIPQEKIFNFNYKEYLYYHKIYGIIKAKPENIKLIKSNLAALSE